jgi:hypothetical protein
MRPVKRGANPNSLAICTAADGNHLKLILILPRKTIDQELAEQGITSAICKMICEDHGFMTMEIFEEYYWEVSSRERSGRQETFDY